MIFVWTLDTVIGAIFFSMVALLFATIGALILAERLQRKWRTWRARSTPTPSEGE